MKKKSMFIIAVSLIFTTFIGVIIFEVATDPLSEEYKDRIEYPLEKVDVNDTSTYMLVKWQHSPVETYEVITDTQAIKDNKSAFSVDNKGEIYGTTADGVIWLFKDRKHIGTSVFDNTFTKKIEYGTLKFQQTNQLQYKLLVGYEIVDQGENYTILCDNRNEKPYYYCFAHGNDLHSIETVYLLNSDSNINKMAKPLKTINDILEFVAPFPTYAGNETRHWYFRLSDCKLSQSYLNVKAIQETIIACTYSDYKGPYIIIQDMFDKATYYKEISGDFSGQADRLFLLSAEFTTDGDFRAEYIGKDGQVHNDIFSLD